MENEKCGSPHESSASAFLVENQSNIAFNTDIGKTIQRKSDTYKNICTPHDKLHGIEYCEFIKQKAKYSLCFILTSLLGQLL